MSYTPNRSKYLAEKQVDSVATSSAFYTGWIDMQSVDKIQVECASDLANQQLIISSSNGISGSGNVILTSTNIPYAFYLFNVTARQRYMNFGIYNDLTSSASTSSLNIKASYGSSDKLSVFPNVVEPSDFSQAALVQAIGKGQQPDGDYVNVPADGAAFETFTPLSASAAYTSSWVDTDGWRSAELFIVSDVASANNGVTIQFTKDSNASEPEVTAQQTYTYSSQDTTNGFFSLDFPPQLDGLRVLYENGSISQSNFNLSCTLKVNPVQEVKKYSGPYYQNNVDFFFSVGEGNQVGHSSNTKFGYNSDIDQGAPEDIWDGGGTYTGFPDQSAAAETIEVFSSSGNDTSAGTGARTIRLYGLDENFAYQTEDVTLNGTSAVTTSGSWHRMNSMQVLSAGSGGDNAGNITARHTTTTANVFAVMQEGRNQTTICAYTVPSGSKMFILRGQISIGRSNGSAGSADWSWRVRPPGGVFNSLRYSTITTAYPNVEIPVTALGPLPEKTDLKVRIDSVSDNNTTAAASFEYMLVENGF